MAERVAAAIFAEQNQVWFVIVKVKILVVYLLAASFAFAQTPAFEVAAVKMSSPQEMGHISTSMSVDDGFLNYTNTSLMDVLRVAYRVPEQQISGPPWLTEQRIDIKAKLPKDYPKKAIPEMLRALLLERFGLEAHTGEKEMSVYALTVAKTGPKLTPVPGDDSSVNRSDRSLKATRISMEQMAEILGQILKRPVVDHTGLKDSYAVTLEWGDDGNPELPSIFTALQETLGLHLEGTKAPVKIVVIDKIAKTPDEN